MKLLSSLSNNSRPAPCGLAILMLCLMTFHPGVAQSPKDSIYTVDVGETLFSIAQKFEISVEQIRQWNELEGNNINAGQQLEIQLNAEEEADTESSPPGTVRLTVEPKQTLYSIAREYEVSMAQIKEWNDLESNQLNVGQELVIRNKSSVSATQDEADEAVEQTDSQDPMAQNATQEEVANSGQDNEEPTETEQVQPAEESTDRETIEEPEVNNDSTPEHEFESKPRPQPEQQQPADTSGPDRYYIVKDGDTLYQIARQFNMSVAQLKSLNQLDTNTINVGQRLIVGTNPDAPSVAQETDDTAPQGQFVQYRMKSNESLTQILEKFQMDSLEFAALNPDLQYNQLVAGRNITVLNPPSSNYRNPYRTQATMERVGQVSARQYKADTRGTPTTSGELYNPYQLTAAHPTMALGTIVYIENPYNGRGIYVKVNDRMTDEGIRLSEAAFKSLHFETGKPNRVIIFRPPQK